MRWLYWRCDRYFLSADCVAHAVSPRPVAVVNPSLGSKKSSTRISMIEPPEAFALGRTTLRVGFHWYLPDKVMADTQGLLLPAASATTYKKSCWAEVHLYRIHYAVTRFLELMPIKENAATNSIEPLMPPDRLSPMFTVALPVVELPKRADDSRFKFGFLLCLVLAVHFTWVPRASVQTTTHEISGQITDPTGGRVPLPDVTIINVGTGVERAAQSNPRIVRFCLCTGARHLPV